MESLQWILFISCCVFVGGNSFLDALNLRTVKSVYPEVFMNSTQMIQYNGYKAENHRVTTQDGFILNIQRIPFGRYDTSGASSRPAVFLQHGLLATSANYLFNGQNASLAYILVDAGYDVWLGNSRGNTYSMEHIKYTPDQEEFWDFSWQDMGDKDLPAVIDYILSNTNQSDLIYVGHSQGTCIGFSAFSRNKDLAKKIKMFIALAPVAKVQHIRGLLELLIKPFRDNLNKAFDLLGRKSILLNSTTNMDIADKICDTETAAMTCSDFRDLIYGHGLKNNVDINRIPVYMSHIPAGTSVRNIVHFAQEIISGHYQFYNFGSDSANMVRYNQTTPPIVNLTAVDVPVALYSGSSDYLADPTDVKFISSSLKKIVEQKEYTQWNHVDFIIGNTAAMTLYKDMINLMKQYH